MRGKKRKRCLTRRQRTRSSVIIAYCDCRLVRTCRRSPTVRARVNPKTSGSLAGRRQPAEKGRREMRAAQNGQHTEKTRVPLCCPYRADAAPGAAADSVNLGCRFFPVCGSTNPIDWPAMRILKRINCSRLPGNESKNESKTGSFLSGSRH